MSPRTPILSALALTLLVSVSANAQQYKYQTPIPPGVASPDTVETRLGTLRFFDGFPDRASADKLYDNLDFQRAVQAYLLALPAVNQAAMRKGLSQSGPANSTLLIFEQLLDSRTVTLTGNNNTPYSLIWIDLHDGPLVLEAPPKVLGVIDDFWYHYVVDIGFLGPDRGDGGKYLLLPPGYKGDVPEGYFVVRPRTFGNFVFWRSFLVDGSPKLPDFSCLLNAQQDDWGYDEREGAVRSELLIVSPTTLIGNVCICRQLCLQLIITTA